MNRIQQQLLQLPPLQEAARARSIDRRRRNGTLIEEDLRGLATVHPRISADRLSVAGEVPKTSRLGPRAAGSPSLGRRSCALLVALVLGASLQQGVSAATIQLSASDVAQAAYTAGFRGGALVNAIAVAGAESNFYLDAHCLDCTGVTEDSRGLWQINVDVHSSYDGARLLNDAVYNAQAAYQIANAAVDANWRRWSGFTSGNFITWLVTPRTAAGNIDSTVIGGLNDTISATTSLNVHASAGSASPTRAVSAGTIGTVIDGPIVSVVGTGAEGPKAHNCPVQFWAGLPM